jgi:bacillithiol biosynthesis cysteine-adding enzyme BshC
MTSECIRYDVAGMLNQLTRDYLDQKESISNFYQYKPEIESFEKLIEERKSVSVKRELLATSLEKQYKEAGHGQSPALANIRLLSDNNTFTVVTGHQLNLFTGPLYFIWKILSTINLTNQLKKKYPDYNFVPVYWMASEDHDFEEVNHTTIFGKKYSWLSNEKGAVGRFSTDGIADVLETLKKDTSRLNAGSDWYKILEEAYEKPTVAQATHHIVDTLFGESGLVIVDGDDADLKRAFIPVMKRDILEQKANSLIEDAAEDLEKLGYKKQVTPREINLFYLKNGLRERIVPEGDHFTVLNTEIQLSKDEILDELDNHPERFSPNVALRPMYQETILPNLAYIGGGAEVAYWLELKRAFDAYDVFYPMVLLRNSVLVLNERAQKKQHQLELETFEIFQPYHDLAKKVVKQATREILSFQRERQDLSAIFDRIRERMQQADPTLRDSAEAAEVKHLHYINSLEKKLLRAEKRNNEVLMQRIDDLKAEISPNGIFQERIVNLTQLISEHGISVINDVQNQLAPMRFELTVVRS